LKIHARLAAEKGDLGLQISTLVSRFSCLIDYLCGQPLKLDFSGEKVGLKFLCAARL
jgi:hypothetical protein